MYIYVSNQSPSCLLVLKKEWSAINAHLAFAPGVVGLSHVSGRGCKGADGRCSFGHWPGRLLHKVLPQLCSSKLMLLLAGFMPICVEYIFQYGFVFCRSKHAQC